MNRKTFEKVSGLLSDLLQHTFTSPSVETPRIDDDTPIDPEGVPLISRLARDYRPPEPVFKAIVKALSLPRSARVLDMGCGGAGGKSTVLHLVDLFDGTIHGWERDPARAAEVSERFGDRVSIRVIDAELGMDEPFDLISVQFNAQDTPRVLGMVADSLASLTKTGGYAVVQIATRSTIDGLNPKGFPPKTLQILNEFFKLNFGTTEPALADLTAVMSSSGFEVVAVVPSNPPNKKLVQPAIALESSENPPVSTIAWANLGITSWVVLRRRLQKGVGMQSAFRLRSGNGFSAIGLLEWLNRLREASIDFELCDRYFAQLSSPRTPGMTRGVSLIKHDIHHDIKRTLRLAKLEAEQNIFGVYFMMPRHDLNAAYYDLEFCWHALREIQAMGHEIGIHVDPFDLITKHADLYVGIEKSIDEFRANGLRISVGNLHGNTKFLYTNVTPFEMFAEYGVQRSANAHPSFAQLSGKYSFLDIWKRCGLKYWLDGRPIAEGVEVDRKTIVYATDNTSRMTIWYSGRGQPESDRFNLNPEFVAESIACLSSVRSMVLLHPQFYG